METELHNSSYAIVQAETQTDFNQEIGDYIGWTIVYSSWQLAIDALLEVPRVGATLLGEGAKNTMYATIVLLMIIKGFPLLEDEVSEPDIIP